MHRAWLATLNNPVFSPSDLPLHPHERYVAWQLEKGELGTPHLQIYVELEKPSRMPAMKAWLSEAHFEPRKGTPDQAREYCMKEDTRIEGPWERGIRGVTQGRRRDLDAAVDLLRTDGLKRVAQDMPVEFVKFHRGLEALARILVEPERDLEFVPKAWQQKLLDRLKDELEDRKIIWVWDSVGNKGKSRLARHLVSEHGAVILDGKVADMAFAYKSEPIVIFDIARTQSEASTHLYSFAERLKNGILFSSKYESGQKIFKPPHVIFFSNMPYPDEGTWSADRKEVISLN